MSTRPLKVGFDLDGVLLYNPARVVRPLLKSAKKLVLQQSKPSFFVPKTGWQETMWQLVHKSSLYRAPGLDDIHTLVEKKKIEAFIVTARFECLKTDYEKWIKILNNKNTFKQCYANFSNSQPHEYKFKMIDKLDLDVFIDDNWDIVSHVNQSFKSSKQSPKVYWITNMFDRSITYPYKFNSLQSAVHHLTNYIDTL